MESDAPPEVEDSGGLNLEESDDEEEEEDEEGSRQSCPLCRIDDVSVETAGAINSTANSRLRRIMAVELVNFGMMPDGHIYRTIAREYNRNISKHLRRAGITCEKWTPSMVRHHFENHVQLVPRRYIGKDLRRLESVTKLVDQEINNCMQVNNDALMAREQAIGELDGQGDPVPVPPMPTEIVDKKILDKLINLSKAKYALLRDYRNYQKEDMLSTGIDTLWKSVQLGETSVTEAKKLLESAATLRSAAGPGDLPNASELFE